MAAMHTTKQVAALSAGYLLVIFFQGLPFYISPAASESFLFTLQFLQLVWAEYDSLLLTVLVLRYFRLIVNVFAYFFLNRPDEMPEHPTITSDMAHVIIPSVDPTNSDFLRCVLSVLEKRPGWVTIVTATHTQTAQARQVLANLPFQHHTQLAVTTGPMANKRHQIAHVLRQLANDREKNKDVLIVLVDDHVWWPSAHFLSAALAPFENPKTGIVTTHKQPERNRGNNFADSLLNFIACLYLERHNFEIAASNAIDGSAFVVSGRTSVMRASIAMEDEFINEYLDEYFFFGMFGPLNPDDDNYITRYVVRKGWNIKWQNQPEAIMETSLGVTGGYSKFYAQLQRWARSQWRSNPCSVFTDRSVWRRGYLWGGYLYCVSFFNFALFWDPLIVYLWYGSSYVGFTAYHLVLVILGSKLIKIAPFFYRNPQDVWLFPFQVLFAYFHSFVKLWALLTFYDCSWGGRNLAAVQAEADRDIQSTDDENNDYEHHAGTSSLPGSSSRQSSTVAPRVTRGRSLSRQAELVAANNSGIGMPQPKSDNRSRLSRSGNNLDMTIAPLGYQTRYHRQMSGHSDIVTPWGRANLVNRHLIPANVLEGQYSLNNCSNFHGTPRMESRSGTRPQGKDVPGRVVVDSPGYLADDEFSWDRSISRADDVLTSLARSRSALPADNYSLHTYEIDTGCLHVVNGNTGPMRSRYNPRFPDAPGRNSIIFKDTSPFRPTSSSAGRFTAQPAQASVKGKPRFTPTRKFLAR